MHQYSEINSNKTGNNKKYIKNMINNVRSNNKYKNYLILNNITVKNDETNSNIYDNDFKAMKNNNKNKQKFIKLIMPFDNTKFKNMVKDHKNLLHITSFTEHLSLGNINENLKYNDYRESDISKLIAFLKSYGITKKNIKIVCHSALMKKLLNKKILNPVPKKYIFSKRKLLEINTENKKLKYIEKNENMWSIILNSSSNLNKLKHTELDNRKTLGEICITRHAFTNANIYKELADKAYIILNPYTKISSKYKQYTDEDTKLSLYGILGALDFENEKINLDDCNNTVFVSILVRTWITALCLYLPKLKSGNEFKLVVSPFIKEPGPTLDNNPIPLSKQIIIIKNFLKFIREKFNENENENENYYKNAKKINDFFNNNNKLVIYAPKKTKSKNVEYLKYLKYEITYDKECYTSKSSIESYFKTKNNLANLNTFYIKNLYILSGVRKPSSKMIKENINSKLEPLTENKIKEKFKNSMSDIKIGIIDINEKGEIFLKSNILDFYNKCKEKLKNLNILVVCTQNSLSIGTTDHFQHLLKDVIREDTNTNFNFKNNNKKNTTQVVPFKTFSSISGSKKGLRTRVYTQGLDNDKLKVDFDSFDFSSTSSNEGGILCSIKYDGEDIIDIMNSYANNIDNVSSTSIKRQLSNIYKQKHKILTKTFFCGNLDNSKWEAPYSTSQYEEPYSTSQYEEPKVDFYIKLDNGSKLNIILSKSFYLNNKNNKNNKNKKILLTLSSSSSNKGSYRELERPSTLSRESSSSSNKGSYKESERLSTLSRESNNLNFYNAESERESTSSISSSNLNFYNAE